MKYKMTYEGQFDILLLEYRIYSIIYYDLLIWESFLQMKSREYNNNIM